MFNIEVITPPTTQPITATDLRAHLRSNDPSEDGQLGDFVAAAIERFEQDALRPILSTSYRQYLAHWPPFPLALGRAGITAVTDVQQYQADGTTLPLSGWQADFRVNPPRVYLASPPNSLTTPAGLLVQPVGYVDFTAGWATAGAVPASVRVALKLLAAHWYWNREAYTDRSLSEVEKGWCAVIGQYKLGLRGAWGQGPDDPRPRPNDIYGWWRLPL